MTEFEEYFELAERQAWRATDLDWNSIDVENMSELDKQLILSTSIIENGFPYYADAWTRIPEIKDEWELWQFAIVWAGEEHRHSYVLKRLAQEIDVVGSPEYYEESRPASSNYYYDLASRGEFGRLQKERSASYNTIAGMLTYTTIQELLASKYYANIASNTKSAFLKDLWLRISKDEARHHAFFANALVRYCDRAKNREEYLDNIFHSIGHFALPHSIQTFESSIFDKVTTFTSRDHAHFKLRIARIMSFDKSLAKRLLKEYSGHREVYTRVKSLASAVKSMGLG